MLSQVKPLIITLPLPRGRREVTARGSGAASTRAWTDSRTTRLRLPGPNWTGSSLTRPESRYGPHVQP